VKSRKKIEAWEEEEVVKVAVVQGGAGRRVPCRRRRRMSENTYTREAEMKGMARGRKKRRERARRAWGALRTLMAKDGYGRTASRRRERRWWGIGSLVGVDGRSRVWGRVLVPMGVGGERQVYSGLRPGNERRSGNW
jgi:hypothetical protein